VYVKLYLVQHGEAKREEEDPARPLTDKGREEARRIARYIAKAGVSVDKILHSGKLRAAQTAEIMAEALSPRGGVEQADGLDPLADPQIWADRLRTLKEDLMLVGHLPHLSRLASLLLTGRTDLEPIKFRMAGVVCLERDESGKWSLLWAIRPELVA